MAWVQDDVDKLKEAIASGASKIQFSDRTIEFRSLQEMLDLLKLMTDEVNGENSSTTAVSPFQSVDFKKNRC